MLRLGSVERFKGADHSRSKRLLRDAKTPKARLAYIEFWRRFAKHVPSGDLHNYCRMRQLALCAIQLYRRYVSPYKGFSCAYRVHTGCASCSTLGYRAIRRYGLRNGLGILSHRLDRCSFAHGLSEKKRSSHRSSQAGFCDMVATAATLTVSVRSSTGRTAMVAAAGRKPRAKMRSGSVFLLRKQSKEGAWIKRQRSRNQRSLLPPDELLPHRGAQYCE
jgi:putative component of membrane protein insertase Oxa1/YidC/SpoIIIJ protein YidD